MSTSNANLKAVPRCDHPAMDRLTENLAQAEALSCLLYGEQGEMFRACNEDIQDRVMWLLRRLLRDARNAAESMV